MENELNVISEQFELLGTGVCEGFRDIFGYEADTLNVQYKSAYERAMEEFKAKYIPAFLSAAAECEAAPEPEEYLAQLIEYITALEKHQEDNLKKKYKLGIRKTDTRLYLVLYVLPVMAETGNDTLKAVADGLVAVWPVKFGGSPLSYTTSETIGAKFGGDWIKRLMGRFGR